MPMPKKPRELKNIDVLEVSLVDAAANKRKFLLAKGAKMNERMIELLKELSPDAQEAVKGMLQIYETFADELPEELFTTLSGLMEGEEGEEGEAGEEMKAQPDPELKEKLSSLWKAQSKVTKELQKQNEILKAELQKQQDEVLGKKYADEATSYKAPEISEEQCAGLLRAVDSKLSEENAALVRKALKSATAVTEEVTTQVGRQDTTDESESTTEFDKIVKEKVEKGMSQAQAYVAAYKENLELAQKAAKE